jgi:hypothetical protein
LRKGLTLKGEEAGGEGQRAAAALALQLQRQLPHLARGQVAEAHGRGAQLVVGLDEVRVEDPGAQQRALDAPARTSGGGG